MKQTREVKPKTGPSFASLKLEFVSDFEFRISDFSLRRGVLPSGISEHLEPCKNKDVLEGL